MNLIIIIHFIPASRVESGHTCILTIQSHSVYVDLDGTMNVTVDL